MARLKKMKLKPEEAKILGSIKLSKKPSAEKKDTKTKEISERKPFSSSNKENELASMIEDDSYDFDYPILISRRLSPSLRASQSVSVPLEIDLSDIPANRNNDEPVSSKPGEYMGQKYELYKTANYTPSGYPKTLTSGSPDVSLQDQFTPSFMQPSSSLKPSNELAASGYPGQINEKKYDSGLEQQSKKEQERRRAW